MSNSGNSSVDTERWECDRCGEKEPEMEQLIAIEIPLTGETWDLCDPCLDDFTRWVDSDTDHPVSQSENSTGSEGVDR